MRSLARVQLAVGRGTTLGNIIERTAAVRGGLRLVEEAGSGLTLTHAEAAERVDRLAVAIASRVDRGGRVVVALPNTYDQFLCCLATCRAGAIAVPLNNRMRKGEIEHVIEDAGAALVVRDLDELADDGGALDVQAEPMPGDVAVLFYTSGTTGKPKGVELTHRSLLRQVTAGALWPEGLRRDEVVVSLPIAHIMGFVSLLGLAVAGLPVWFLPKFRPDEVLDAIEERRSTVFVGVPAMYRLLEEAGADKRDLSSIRLWIAGADTMPSDLAKRFKGYGATVTLPLLHHPVGEAAFAEGYGMVEVAGGVATKLSPPLLDFGLGDGLGVPLPGYRFRVVDDDGRRVGIRQEGELLVKGPGLTKGYWGSPEATADLLTDDGWLRTGDLVRRGPLGTAVFAGRKKDVIITGGYTVFAREVEAALEAHPEVVEAGVTGIPDERVGEVPVAAVRLTADATVTCDELSEWVAERLSEYKAPKRIVAVDELPQTGTRKVRRQELQALF